MNPPTFLSCVKRAAFTEALVIADFIQIVCATHMPGVVVPIRYMGKETRTIALNIGYRLTRPIPDLVVDEWGVCGTLLFNDKPFYVKLPWESVWNINHPSIPVGMMFSMEPGGAVSELADAPLLPAQKPTLKLVK